MFRLFFLLSLLIRVVGHRRVFNVVNLAWRLTFDKRVSLLLRLLTPAIVVVYLFTPFSRINYVGLGGLVLTFFVGIRSLIKFAPRHVVTSYTGQSDRVHSDEGQVVEGKYEVIDENYDPK